MAPLHTPRAFFVECLDCGVEDFIDFYLYASVLVVEFCADYCNETVLESRRAVHVCGVFYIPSLSFTTFRLSVESPVQKHTDTS